MQQLLTNAAWQESNVTKSLHFIKRFEPSAIAHDMMNVYRGLTQ
jgi:hypothetical protein